VRREVSAMMDFMLERLGGCEEGRIELGRSLELELGDFLEMDLEC
jgi:hypothetical protein